MSFNSYEFALFFPVVVLISYLVPGRLRTFWLLISSYYFYMSWNPRYALLIALSTLITWGAALVIGKLPDTSVKARRGVLIITLAANLGILFVFKYANFALESAESVLSALGIRCHSVRLDVLLPVGISFYTFQALSYIMDVYRDTIKPEKDLLRYALFVSFFPQLVAGPIERSGRLLPQLDRLAGRSRTELWDAGRVMEGLLLMLWGLFMKLTIADRVSPLVRNVYENYREMGAVEIAVAAVLFSLQIYCDFGGYTCIARGAARVLGIELMQNFRQPYFARGIRDFWRRWHISLTGWFTDYLYIPLGGNRRGTLRRYLNILIVFGLSGLWHGASWNYVVWGLLHAFFQITEDLFTRKAQQSVRIPDLFRIIGTFAIVTVAWIFFAADSCGSAIGILGQCFRAFHMKKLTSLGLDTSAWAALGICTALLFFVDLIHEKGRSVFAGFRRIALPLQALMSAALLWTVILLGAYGGSYDASFIYFRF